MEVMEKTEGFDAVNQLMIIMKDQNMKEQSEDLREVLSYIVGLQVQFGAMVNELQGIKEQLIVMQSNQPKSVKESLQEKMTQLEDKATGILEHLAEIKNHLVETATKAVAAFKEKGQQKLNQVLHNGISKIQKILGNCRKQVVEVLNDYEKTSRQIDSIGDELKQIGNSFANVGRILSGKETKTVSEEKRGVGITRAMNMPVKQAISNAEKKLNRIDRMNEKLNNMKNSLKTENNEERNSVVKKLSQMKEKAEKQHEQPEQPGKKQELCM